ncbi:MAG: flagellar biosynthesis protein FlgE [Cereibacter sphaeroides]|uniref:Flagellar hook protein FlgE n=1 Tax=Cereibacter sphaeroides TaxID=1063 RepID=A0A2W5SEA5_CERSP|nr:MAG: flagellar biosynthesis protein FlgE [Cereibacter sphaeroides]
MTISSSLNAGVAGLNANATKLATISDNIANSSTYGYRRVEADFSSMVLQGGSSAKYSAGGVRASTMRLIDQKGPLVSTTNATDLAVDGRGMLPVTTLNSVSQGGGSYPLSLMTTGSFRANEDGYLVTQTGLVLMGWPANPDGTIPQYSRVSAAGLQPVRINLNQFAANPTTEMVMSVNLPATETAATAAGEDQTLAIEYFGNLGTSEMLDVTFTPTIPASGLSNQWTLTLRDSASGGAIVGEYTLTFDDAQGSGGTLLSVTTVSGGAYDPATGKVGMTLAGGPVSLSLGKLGATDGMTQLSDTFAPVTLGKNGSPVASVTSVQVDEKGDVYAIYDQGFTRRIYQIPLVDVPNVNGLVAQSNQTYQISSDSGAMFLWDAGDGPTGSVVGFAREESATDVAAELTQLIQTQRAYSSNAKVIQTVDEMLQETSNIKR